MNRDARCESHSRACMPTPTAWRTRKYPHQLTRRLSIPCTGRLRLAIKLLLGTMFVVLGIVACNGVSSPDPVTARPERRAAANSVAATSVGEAPRGNERSAAATAAAAQEAGVREVASAPAAESVPQSTTDREGQTHIADLSEQDHPLGGSGGLNCLLAFSPQDLRHQASFVEWRADSSEIVFSARSGVNTFAVYAVSPDGRRLRTVVSARPTVSFSLDPDGPRLVYTTCDYQSSDLPSDRPWLFHQELALMDLDQPEAPVVQLTTNEVFDYYPSWSPEGQHIAFFQGAYGADLNDEAPGAINVIRADGSGARWLHGQELILGAPSWSSDGRWLAFAKDEANSQAGLFVVQVQDRVSRRLSDTLSRPSWSPDGQHLAFARRDGRDVALYALTVGTATERRITSIEFEPPPTWIPAVAWSPDGKHILYGCETGLCVVTPEGTRVGELPVKVQAAAWSPDGSRIAAILADDASFLPIHAVPVFSTVPDGSDLRPLVSGNERRGWVAAMATDGRAAADAETCASEFVIYEPADHPDLIRDCETLIAMRRALLGNVVLYWHHRIAIGDWVGVAVTDTPPRITGLWLDRLNLPGHPGPLPPDPGDLGQLRTLQLRHNQYTGPIPPELGQLTELSRLDLRDNHLTGPIPAELAQLKSLEVLLLGGNPLTGCIPLKLGRLKLAQSDLRNLGLPNCESAG